MGHKKVCFTCRKAFSTYTNEAETIHLICPECGGKTLLLSHRFRPPKRENIKQWDIVKFITDHGFTFEHVYKHKGSGVYTIVPYPETMEEAKEFVIVNKHQI